MVDAATLAHWHLDDVAAGVASDTVLNQRPLAVVGAIALPALGTGRIGRERQFTTTQLLGRAATAADMAWAQATWTMSLWVRPLAFPVATGIANRFTLAQLGGRDADATQAENIQASIGFHTDASVVPFPGSNGEARMSLITESGASVGNSMVVSGVDFRRFIGQWVLVSWRKTVGAPFTYEAFVNGRLVQTFTAQPNSDQVGSLAQQRWTLGGVVDTAGVAIAKGFSGRVCSWHAQVGVLSSPELEDMWRRGAGLALPTAQHVRLFAQDQALVFRDLTDPSVVGDDFLEGVEINHAVDDQTEQITATMFRESGDLSLAPLRGDSFLNNPTLAVAFTPFVGLWRQVRLELARVPSWLAATATDWINRFEGRIDTVDDGGDRLVITSRDTGCRMAERWVDDPRLYPTATELNTNGCGVLAGGRQSVMQAIINNNGGAPAFGAFATLFTPIPSQSCMIPMQQPLARSYLLPTLRIIGAQIGWNVRSKWDPSTDTHRLTMFDPGRGRVDCDVVIAAGDIVKQPGSKQDASGVRNHITVTFPDRTSVGLPTDQGLNNPNSTFVASATSIVQFDERKMEIVEDQSSQIDTPVESTRMAQAILDDLAFPLRQTAQELIGIPEMEIDDLCILQPDMIRTTINQEGAIRNLRHSFAVDSCSTTVDAQGKPAAGYRRWLSIEAGRNGRPPIRNPGEALTGRGLGTLLPGLLDIVDRSIYLGGIKYVEIKNGEFARFTRGTAYPPDAWTMRAGLWGTDVFATTTQVSAGFALRIANTTGQIVSQQVPIVGDGTTPYSVECVWQRTAATGKIRIDMEFLNAAGVVVFTNTLQPQSTPLPEFKDVPAGVSGVWFTSRADGINPTPFILSTARFARFVVRGSTLEAFNAILVDRVSVYRTARELVTFTIGNYVTPPGFNDLWKAIRWTTPDFPASLYARYDWGQNAFDSGASPFTASTIPSTGEAIGLSFGSGFYAREDMTVLVDCIVAIGANAAQQVQVRLVVNAVYDVNHTNVGGIVVAQGPHQDLVNAVTLGNAAITGLGLNKAGQLLITARISLKRGDRVTAEWYKVSNNMSPIGVDVTVNHFSVKQELTQ